MIYNLSSRKINIKFEIKRFLFNLKAEAISDRICIKSGGKINVRISAQELTSCTSGGCNGGLLTKAWKYFQKNGIVSGGNYKSNGGCQAYTIPSCDHHINQT